ncbi:MULTISPECIES: pPIWI_RE_Y domain-containing protein [Streptomyces]|uniref:Fis family transcriptional regulator n=1 Tax=Streptomyces tsukubensis (strain DSM 42081 / NBRC 108919 / NRRL 18488 / 9993) TaxID=1114943 RepID=I2N664_STRT9|nr:HU-CCDC81 and SPOR domain-containing protein [Streptomyces tsukubensis]MYS64750.1 Fis family transcriptional regulator [Streptomyces sp. SID5473]AZK96492.1 Fis family transcriptional regulator [Streptomyces tsukubensis]EIF92511.1 hypothetical protein [Streptomyces tsukubensis NRRL18488]QKM67504.1 Fis family transcriptional regulator [Streptomyces tsukubensis NRRL18488]TAI43899.1 Fis family transcriptional regulator [Streptomyces tsukubensis]
MHPSGTTTDWENEPGVELVELLARAVVALEDITELSSFRLPYPHVVHQALNRTALVCLLRRAEPPRSVPELLSWCRDRPLANWLLDLPADAAGPADRLLDEHTGLPTELVREWWAHQADVPARLHHQDVLRWALQRCRSLGPESYGAFRRLLVEHPVLTHTEWFKVISNPALMGLPELLENIYQPVPSCFVRPGRGCAQCRRCGTLLTPVGDADWWCERDYCRSESGEPPIDRIIPPEQCKGLVQLDRPLRQFVTWPGRIARGLRKRLTRLGATVTMWPTTEAYIMRVGLPDGRSWAVDIKDRAHPALLGRSAGPAPAGPPHHETLWVVPGHRVRARPDYLTVFHRNHPRPEGGISLLPEGELLLRAERHIRESGGGPADA